MTARTLALVAAAAVGVVALVLSVEWGRTGGPAPADTRGTPALGRECTAGGGCATGRQGSGPRGRAPVDAAREQTADDDDAVAAATLETAAQEPAHAQADPPAPAEPPKPAAVRPMAPLQLVTTVVDPGHTSAVFRTASGAVRIAGVGGLVEGAIVTAITNNSATLQCQGRLYTFVAQPPSAVLFGSFAPEGGRATAADPPAAAVAQATDAAGAPPAPPAAANAPQFNRVRRQGVFARMLEARARFQQSMQSPGPTPAENPPAQEP